MADLSEGKAESAAVDFFDHAPTPAETAEMRNASKAPSEWLCLLCRDWAAENPTIMDEIDSRFLKYKKYLKGRLSSQLLCRLSVEPQKNVPVPMFEPGPMPVPSSTETDAIVESAEKNKGLKFWETLGVEDEFDQNYIISQIERFCQIYNIRGVGLGGVGSLLDEDGNAVIASLPSTPETPGDIAVPAVQFSALPQWNVDPTQAAAAVAAAAAAHAVADNSLASTKLSRKQANQVARANRKAKEAEKALEQERRNALKLEQRRQSEAKKLVKAKEREENAAKKAAEKAAREAERLEKRKKKLEMRMQREKILQTQKDAALKRAAELVESNRVPVELTRGAGVAAKLIPQREVPSGGAPGKKGRSRIVISTASDLDQIVTHSNNLWAKYSAIAKEHNQKVNWVTVANEIGIHVKVREKYARMHHRAKQRGFDFERNGHFKIKDNPGIFLEPLQTEASRTLIGAPMDDGSHTISIQSGNANVTAATLVDPTGVLLMSSNGINRVDNNEGTAEPMGADVLQIKEEVQIHTSSSTTPNWII